MNPLNSTGQSMEHILIIYMRKRTLKRTSKHLHLSESSTHTPETNTISEINSTPK